MRKAEFCCAGGFPVDYAQLPKLLVNANGRQLSALLDSGCTRSIIRPSVVSGMRLESCRNKVVMMNGIQVDCVSSCKLKVTVGHKLVELDCLVMDMLPGYDMLMGMDAMKSLGGVRISEKGEVYLNEDMCLTAASEDELKNGGIPRHLEINDVDFSAVFNKGKWTVHW